MPRAKIQIAMDDTDFGYLLHNSAKWADSAGEWEPQLRNGRFTASEPGVLTGHWKMAYWIGSDYTAVILARAFLAAWGYECQILTDEASGGGWVILTDYEWKLEEAQR